MEIGQNHSVIPMDSTGRPVVPDDSYAQVLAVLGMKVWELDHTKWFMYREFLVPAYLPHCCPTINSESAAAVRRLSGAPFARWESEFDRAVPSAWWQLIRTEHWSRDACSANTRSKLRRGWKKLHARLCTPEEVGSLGYPVCLKAVERFGDNSFRPSMEQHQAKMRAARLFPDAFQCFGVFAGDQLVGFSENHLQQRGVFWDNIWYDPDFLGQYSGYVLIEGMLDHYLNQRGLLYVTDGARNVYHQTNVHNFLTEVFGFRRAYSNLHVVYSSRLALTVRTAYRFRVPVWHLQERVKLTLLRKLGALLFQEQVIRSCRPRGRVILPAEETARIARATHDDFQSIAQLHSESITEGFLPTLGLPFLANVYRGISAAPRSGVLVARDTNAVLGFAAYTADLSACYRWVLTRRFFLLALSSLPNVLNLRIYKRMVETLLYPLRAGNVALKNASRPYRAELLAIAVSDHARGRGLGKKLLHAVEDHFQALNIAGYCVVTHAIDDRSNKFYSGCGLRLQRAFFNHGKPMNEYVRILRP